MEPFPLASRVKGMALGALAGEFPSPSASAATLTSSRSVAHRRQNGCPRA